MEKISVLLVDDHPTFLQLAASYLAKQEGLVVVGTIDKGAAALKQTGELKPDLVLVDLTLPDVSGLKLLSELRAAFPSLAIIALTMHSEISYREAALAAGADRFITKSNMITRLVPAIRELQAAAAPLSAGWKQRLIDE